MYRPTFQRAHAALLLRTLSNCVLLKMKPHLCNRCKLQIYGRPIHASATQLIPSSQPIAAHQISGWSQTLREDRKYLFDDIKKLMATDVGNLKLVADYQFDGQGKALRPMLVITMAKALNSHTQLPHRALNLQQRQVAIIAEMIHTASLIHDDVIDSAQLRRSKPSVFSLWGERKATFAGDFILAMASVALANIRNEEVVVILSQVLEDLVKGEFMQLGTKESEEERFAHYLEKTYRKTASLLANSCKAVAVLGKCQDHIVKSAFEYGRNIGIAFQLVDDLLDFISSEALMGKPTAADLKLGLATAPVLLAALEHPELNALIMRRFSQEGDIARTLRLVEKSSGIQKTKDLAHEYGKAAIQHIQQLSRSDERVILETLVTDVLTRMC